MPISAAALRDPIALTPNRIPRFYRGGGLLGRFRGVEDPPDGAEPEDWVGSATAIWRAPEDDPELGVSRVEVDGRRTTIARLVGDEPEAMVGSELLARAGPTPGLLVKLLDAGERLPVHCHPTRPTAARLLGSRFGKTEAWLILATRAGAPGRVWAGFREPPSREALRRWIDGQDTDALLEALAEHEVGAGDVVLVPGGMPHAIGAGVLLLELQEPTDFSIVAETRGFPIDEADATLGLGWDRAIDAFEPDAAPFLSRPADDATSLLPPEADAYFRLRRQRLDAGTAAPPFAPAYAVGVVLAGAGAVHGATRSLELRVGSTFALPAAGAGIARLESAEPLEVAWCLGPEPAALDREPLPTLDD